MLRFQISSSPPFNKVSFLPVCVYWTTLAVWFVCLYREWNDTVLLLFSVWVLGNVWVYMLCPCLSSAGGFLFVCLVVVVLGVCIYHTFSLYNCCSVLFTLYSVGTTFLGVSSASLLVLSPVNHKGLHQSWAQTSLLSPGYSFHKSSYHKSCFLSLFIFRGHSTREPASSRVFSFILRAYTGTGVSHSQHREKIGRFLRRKKCKWMDLKGRNKQGRNPWQ